MIKYKLTTGQRIYLFFLFPVWILFSLFKLNAKSWHEVKKGMEKHKHDFSILYRDKGKMFLGCSHEGCSATEKIGIINEKNIS